MAPLSFPAAHSGPDAAPCGGCPGFPAPKRRAWAAPPWSRARMLPVSRFLFLLLLPVEQLKDSFQDGCLQSWVARERCAAATPSWLPAGPKAWPTQGGAPCSNERRRRVGTEQPVPVECAGCFIITWTLREQLELTESTGWVCRTLFRFYRNVPRFRKASWF